MARLKHGEGIKKIEAFLKEKPNSTPTEIVKGTGLSPGTVYGYLSRKGKDKSKSKYGKIQEVIVPLLKENPNLTAKEIISITGLKSYQVYSSLPRARKKIGQELKPKAKETKPGQVVEKGRVPEPSVPHYPSAEEIVDALISKAEREMAEARAWKERYYDLEKDYNSLVDEHNRLLKARNKGKLEPSMLKQKIDRVLSRG